MTKIQIPILTADHLGQVLVTERKRRRLTQAAIAGRLGLSQNRVSYLEKNPEAISIKQLLSWCAALDIEIRVGEKGIAESTEW